MEFDELLHKLTERMESVTEITADASGSVSLMIDEMPVTLLHLDELNQVAIVGEIGEPPPEDRMERLYKALLQANYNFSGTAGATLAISPETNKVTLCMIVPLALHDEDSFFVLAEKYINSLELWRHVVSSFSGAAAADDGSLGAPDEAPAAAVPDAFGLGGNGFMQV